MSIDSKILAVEAELARSREQLVKTERQLGEERRQHQALEATLRAEASALRSDLAALRARFDRESEIYENTKNDLRNRLHTCTQRAERAERVVSQWFELRALLVDDPAEAARRLDVHREQEQWSREPDVDSRPWDDESEDE